MSDSKVYQLENSIIRYDEYIGLFLYSCKNSLIYAYSDKCISDDYKKSILEGRELDEIVSVLFKELNEESRLLPTEQDWFGPEQEKLRRPITINWLITKKCTHKCPYCYSTDVMNNESMFENDDIYSVADRILSYEPLNVVISGGEPLLHDKLKDIILYLSGKAGIILDTNGQSFDKLKKLVPILIENRVVVRISIDNLRIKRNFILRSPKGNNINMVDNLYFPLKALKLLKKNNIEVVIQTVVSRKNISDLFTMGHKLYVLGVRVWRLFELQKTSCNRGLIESEKIEVRKRVPYMDKKKIDNTRYYIDELVKRNKKYWSGLTFVYTTATGAKNNVFLVLPDGEIYTEGQHDVGKIKLDKNEPLRDLNRGAHFSRYINKVGDK